MREVTQEQANLMLRLYELRCEPVMREARAWFLAKFHPQKEEDAASTITRSAHSLAESQRRSAALSVRRNTAS